MSQTLSKEYLEGYDNYGYGYKRDDNPYKQVEGKNTDKAIKWYRGWLKASKGQSLTIKDRKRLREYSEGGW